MFSRFQNVVKLIFVGTSAFMKSLQFGSDEKSEMLIFVTSCYKWFRGVRLLEIFKNALLKMKISHAFKWLKNHDIITKNDLDETFVLLF